MAWYRFRQNNSGGCFVTDEKIGVSVEVYIEADSEGEANELAQTKGIYFDGVDSEIDCDCCGDRWYRASSYDAQDEPPAPNEKWEDDGPFALKWVGDGPEIFVHPKGKPFYASGF